MRRRYQLTQDGVRYDLTGDQFDLLSKKVIRLKFPTEWKLQRRANGLEAKGLISRSVATSKSVTYKRTETGTKVFKALRDKEDGRGKVTVSKKR